MKKNGTTVKNEGRSQKWICKKCKKTLETSMNQDGEATKTEPTEQDPKQKPDIALGINEAELRRKHDILFRIREAAKRLEGDLFLTDQEFIRLCELMGAHYRDYLEKQEFDQYKGRAGKTIYWSNPVNIKRLKNEGILL